MVAEVYSEIGGAMRLEEQVCSLELAKRLKELGVRQESAFYWQFPKPMESLPFNKRPFEERHDWFLTNSGNLEWCKEEMRTAAFSVAELGEMLPSEITLSNGKKAWLWCGKMDRLEVCYDDTDTAPLFFHADTEANARAKMLIHLIEHWVVKI